MDWWVVYILDLINTLTAYAYFIRWTEYQSFFLEKIGTLNCIEEFSLLIQVHYKCAHHCSFDLRAWQIELFKDRNQTLSILTIKSGASNKICTCYSMGLSLVVIFMHKQIYAKLLCTISVRHTSKCMQQKG